MKAIKRTVAALLATLMLATSTSFTLAAENYSDAEAVVVAKVNAAGIMTGTDKGFEPSKSLTRAEAAAIIVRMKGISESAVKATAGTTLFGDVAASHWASGYVNQASNLGIVKGVSATEFAPDREVTVAEFTTMAVRALGAGQLVDSEGTWPTNYVNFANEQGILDDVNAIYTAVATRMNAATIVANTLKAQMWEKVGVKSNGEIEWGKVNTNILTKVLKITPVLNSLCFAASTTDNTYNNEEVNEKFNLNDIKVGLTYDLWKDEDGVILGIWESEKSDLTKVSFNEIKSTSTTKITLVDENGKEKEYNWTAYVAATQSTPASGTYVMLNEKDEKAASTPYLINTDIVKDVDMFGTAYVDGKDLVAIYAEQYNKFGIVDEVKATKLTMDTEDMQFASNTIKSGSIVTNNEDDEFFVTKNGKALSLDEVKAGDAVRYYTVELSASATKYVMEVIDGIEGEVKSLGSKVKIGSDKYDYDSNITFGLNKEVQAYTNKAGKIVMVKTIKDTAADVAVVKYIRNVKDKYNDDNYEVELYLTDGTTTDTLTIDLADTYEENNMSGYDAEDPDKTKEKIAFAALTLQKGSIVCYEINGEKVTIKPQATNYRAIASCADEDASIVVGNKVSYVKETSKPQSTVVYNEMTIDKDTKIFNIKTKDNYSVKVEEVAFDDLDSTPSVAGFFADYDDTEKTAGILFLSNVAVRRSTATNFAWLKSVSKTKYDDENALEVETYLMDGTKTTLYYIEKDLESGSAKLAYDGYAAKFADIKVSGDKITNIDLLDPSVVGATETLTPATPNATITKVFNNDEFTIGSTKYLLADNVLVLKYDADAKTKYTVTTFDSIEEFDSDAKKKDVIKNIVSYKEDVTDADSKAEVVFVIYERVDNN